MLETRGLSWLLELPEKLTHRVSPGLDPFAQGRKVEKRHMFQMVKWCHAAGALRRVCDFLPKMFFFSFPRLPCH